MDLASPKGIKKDRKVLRQLDVSLASQSRFTVLANVLFFLLVTTVGEFYLSHPVMSLGLGITLVVLAGLNLLLTQAFDRIYGAGPARWRSLFMLNQIAVSLFVGVFSAGLLLVEGLSINGFLAVLYVLGYSCLNNVDWSAYSKVNIVRLISTCIPPMAAAVVIGSIHGVVIAVFIFVMWVLLVRQCQIMDQRFWNDIKSKTELQTKARDLAQAVNQANDASRFKSEFLASLTHEIRTPMNNVLGVLALLDDTALNEQQRELQRVAVNSGEALLNLMEDILDYSKISSGQIQLVEKVFNLKRCIDHAIDLMGPRAHERGIELSCIYGDDLPTRVKADEGRLVQLINNLVSNAIKYSDGSDVLVSIESIKYSRREAEIKVSVKDNGKGVDPEIQNHIFDVFSKQSNVAKTAEVGSGLGLAISRGLAQVMGGDIGFVTHPGLGSEFWFTAQLQVSTQQAQKHGRMQALGDKKALCIGKMGNVLDSLKTYLNEWEINCDHLTGAPKTAVNFDLVFINLAITQKFDVQELETLLDELQPLECPVIVLSSLLQRADALRTGLRERESTYWLTKPITGEKMHRIISSLFSVQALPQTEAGENEKRSGYDIITGIQVLLVEDNAVNQMVAKSMLVKLGCEVTCVANGKEALGLLEQKSFDLILMDCLMPVLDGYETTKAWRVIEEGGDQHVPIIAMTASVVEGEQQRCLVAGMDDYLAKPVNIEELNAKIRQWLGDRSDPSKSERKSA